MKNEEEKFKKEENGKHHNFLRFCAFAVIFSLFFAAIANFLCTADRKDTLHIKGFYMEPKNTVDVILIGPSEMYTGFNSPLAWKEYGFTSYSIAYAGARGIMYKSMLETALSRQNPKLVVVEVNGLLYTDKIMNDTNVMLSWFIAEPWSKEKVKTIRKLVPRSKQRSFFLTFDKFHDNWRHPQICYDSLVGRIKMDKAGICYTKSFATTTSIRDTAAFNNFEPHFTDTAEKSLRELLDYCQDSGLKNVLFIRGPHCLDNKFPEVYDKISAIVHEYGYDFQNFENSFSEIGLDTVKDFYNPDHVNVYGMEKYTAFLGKYIVDHYDVKSEHTQEVIDSWNLCVVKMEDIIVKAKKDLANGVTNTYYEISAY